MNGKTCGFSCLSGFQCGVNAFFCVRLDTLVTLVSCLVQFMGLLILVGTLSGPERLMDLLEEFN